MQFLSPHLWVRCLRAEGKRGSGAPRKGSGRQEAFPSRMGLQRAPGFPQLPSADPEVLLLVASSERAAHVPAVTWASGWLELR